MHVRACVRARVSVCVCTCDILFRLCNYRALSSRMRSGRAQVIGDRSRDIIRRFTEILAISDTGRTGLDIKGYRLLITEVIAA